MPTAKVVIGFRLIYRNRPVRLKDTAIPLAYLDLTAFPRFVFARGAGRGRRALAWLAAIALAAAIGLGLASLLGDRTPPVVRMRIDVGRPPEPPANRLRPLTAEQAAATNAAMATSVEPLEPAGAFLLPQTLAGELARGTAIDCLTSAIYYEAASESLQGQRAVAQVVLNRVRHPAFPKSVCGVVYQGSERRTGCQFSFTCDGSLARRPSRSGWDRAAGVAAMALNGLVEPSVGTATHYHTVWVVPYWADSLTKLATIGAHIFYRWPGYWGRRAAFTGRYLGETNEVAPGIGEEATALPAAAMPDPLAADAAPLTRLLADEANGQLVVPVRPAIAPVPLAADRQPGKLIADEAAGVLRGAPEERRRGDEGSGEPAPTP